MFPEPLLLSLEALSSDTGLSRSELLRVAAQELVDRRRPVGKAKDEAERKAEWRGEGQGKARRRVLK